MSLECPVQNGLGNERRTSETSHGWNPKGFDGVDGWVEGDSHESRLNFQCNTGGTVMNSVIYLVGLVVVVLAILSFFGLN